MIPSLLTWLATVMDLFQYNESTLYSLNDIVTIDNNLYISLCDNNLGESPQYSNKWSKLI